MPSSPASEEAKSVKSPGSTVESKAPSTSRRYSFATLQAIKGYKKRFEQAKKEIEILRREMGLLPALAADPDSAAIPVEPFAATDVSTPAPGPASAIQAEATAAPVVAAPAPASTIPAESSAAIVVTTPATIAAMPSQPSSAPDASTPAPASAILIEPPSAPAVITPARARATPAMSGPDPAPDFADPSQAKALQLQPCTIMPPSFSLVAEVPPFPSLIQGGGHALLAFLPGMAGSSIPFGHQLAPSVPASSTSVFAAGFHPHAPVMPSRESFIFDPGGHSSFSWLY